MPDDPVPDSHLFILDSKKENSSLSLACIHLVCRIFSSNIDIIAELLKQSNSSLSYAQQHWFGHLEGAGGNWKPILKVFKSLADAMEVAYRCLQRYAVELVVAKEEAIALAKGLRDTADFVRQYIGQGK